MLLMVICGYIEDILFVSFLITSYFHMYSVGHIYSVGLYENSQWPNLVNYFC